MSDFNTILLRERFVISGSTDHTDPEADIAIALSNRMAVPLIDKAGREVERFVVRAQNMHSSVRLASKVAYEFIRGGPIANRDVAPDWQEIWEQIQEEHEKKYNPDLWCVLYCAGKKVFSSGAYHPFLDIIEHCDSQNKKDYDYAVSMAEDAFKKAGRNVRIDHDSNTALVVTVGAHTAKCGAILRNPNRKMTFSFTVKEKDDYKINIPQCLTVCAAYLEGIQLSFLVGMANEKERLGELERYSHEDLRAQSARRRLGRINAEIRSFENLLDVQYRPDRPEFGALVTEAEHYIRKISTPKEETAEEQNEEK